jgi:hypothetical protein
VGFLDRPLHDVLQATETWFRKLGQGRSRKALGRQPLLDHLLALAPLQMPVGRQLVVGTVGRWTMHADNSRSGGDSVSWVGHLSEVLGCRGVIARHVPPSQYRYPSTQFELLGPGGKPPLFYVRTITAGIYDEERWRFEARGEVQPFETVERYGARRIRDRFDRQLLIQYLSSMGIYADDSAFFTTAILFENADRVPHWTATLEQAREERIAGAAPSR